jgi:hypothetical protein
LPEFRASTWYTSQFGAFFAGDVHIGPGTMFPVGYELSFLQEVPAARLRFWRRGKARQFVGKNGLAAVTATQRWYYTFVDGMRADL